MQKALASALSVGPKGSPHRRQDQSRKMAVCGTLYLANKSFRASASRSLIFLPSLRGSACSCASERRTARGKCAPISTVSLTLIALPFRASVGSSLCPPVPASLLSWAALFFSVFAMFYIPMVV